MNKHRTLYTNVSGTFTNSRGEPNTDIKIEIQDADTGQTIGTLDNEVLRTPFGAKLITAIENIRKGGAGKTELALGEKIAIYRENHGVSHAEATRIVTLETLVENYRKDKGVSYAAALTEITRRRPELWGSHR